MKFKRKHRLFGNIKFIAELYKEHLLSDKILKDIFKNLLDPGKFSDDSIEAAIIVMERVGPKIEEKAK